MIALAFHHAGGSAAVFKPLERSLQREGTFNRPLRFAAVELPGRGRRSCETLFTDVRHVLDDLADRCRPFAHEDFIVLGHSMGAYLGLLLLDLIGDRWCKGLVAMSNAAPSCARPMLQTSALTADDHAILAVAERFGGLPPAILADPVLRARTLGVLRADLAVCDSILERGIPAVKVDIQVMIGSEDVYHPDDISPWTAASHGNTTFHDVPGGHFFVQHHPDVVRGVLISDVMRSHGA